VESSAGGRANDWNIQMIEEERSPSARHQHARCTRTFRVLTYYSIPLVTTRHNRHLTCGLCVPILLLKQTAPIKVNAGGNMGDSVSTSFLDCIKQVSEIAGEPTARHTQKWESSPSLPPKSALISRREFGSLRICSAALLHHSDTHGKTAPQA